MGYTYWIYFVNLKCKSTFVGYYLTTGWNVQTLFIPNNIQGLG